MKNPQGIYNYLDVWGRQLMWHGCLVTLYFDLYDSRYIHHIMRIWSNMTILHWRIAFLCRNEHIFPDTKPFKGLRRKNCHIDQTGIMHTKVIFLMICSPYRKSIVNLHTVVWYLMCIKNNLFIIFVPEYMVLCSFIVMKLCW